MKCVRCKNPDYERDGIQLYLGDCREVLPHLSGVDAVVTDPPYGISFVKGPSGGAGSRNNQEAMSELKATANHLTRRTYCNSKT